MWHILDEKENVIIMTCEKTMLLFWYFDGFIIKLLRLETCHVGLRDNSEDY